MKNCNVILIGQTGSGKTSMALRMLAVSPRAIVFDLDNDEAYDRIGKPFTTLRDAGEFYLENLDKDFQILYRAETPLEHIALMDVVYHAHLENPSLPPIAFFIEESSKFSSSHKVHTILEDVTTRGRRKRISVVSVVQYETQIHPIIRANSQVWVCFRQIGLSSGMKNYFDKEAQDKMRNLEILTPFKKPIPGKHYLMYPPDLDFLEYWKGIVASTPKGVYTRQAGSVLPLRDTQENRPSNPLEGRAEPATLTEEATE